VIFGVMLAYYKIAVSWAILWVPVLLVVQALFALSVVCITAALNVGLRDVGHAIPLMLQLWMFATPVAYPLDIVPAALRPLYELNPMTSIIEGYRRAILQGVRPDLPDLAIAVVITVVLLAIGYTYFKRSEATFADVI
jgi:lipopolysaccharide transport system permease protein